MRKRKSLVGYACVGTHGKIYCCSLSQDLRLQGRYEIYDNWKDARNNAWSEKHIIKVKIEEISNAKT